MVTPKPETYRTTKIRKIVVQGAVQSVQAILGKWNALPVLRQHRAVLYKVGSSVRDLFRDAQVGHLCQHERVQCRITKRQAPLRSWSNENVPVLRSGMLVEGAAHRDELESDDEDDVTTNCSDSHDCLAHDGNFESDSDEGSFMQDQPTWIQHQLDHPNPYPWIPDNQQAFDGQMLDEEEEDEEDQQWVQGNELLGHLIYGMDGDQFLTLVTFGIGLTDLGMRETDIQIRNLGQLHDHVHWLWRDHAAVADFVIHVVNPQPELEVGRSYCALLVDFRYDQMDLDAHKAILVQETPSPDRQTWQRPYAFRLPARNTFMGWFDAIQVGVEIYPKGVRDAYLKCGGLRVAQSNAFQVENGQLCVFQIGAYPLHLRAQAEMMRQPELLYMDLRDAAEEADMQMVHCHIHGASPSNQPLGMRELVLPFCAFFGIEWIDEVRGLWPFHNRPTSIAYVMMEDPAVDRIAREQRHVWTQTKHRSKFESYEEKTEAYEGKFYELLLHTHTHTKTNILAVLLDEDDRDDLVPDAISMIQTAARVGDPWDAFAEICQSIKEAANLSPVNLETEDNVNLRRGDECDEYAIGQNTQIDPELQTLREALQDLQQPGVGLNLEFEQVPNMHFVAQFALSVTDFTDDSHDRIHIFTDGLADKHNAAWAFTVLAESRANGQTSLFKVGYAADRLNDSLGPFVPCAQDAQATAIIAMTEYALALTHCRKCFVFCHFDAKNAGFGSMGMQNTPKYHGKLSERQHAARVMVSLLQQATHHVHAIHVHAHDLHPWNECSDSIAGAVRKGWFPPQRAVLRSDQVLQHKIRDWAWIEIAPTKELPGLREILANRPPDHQPGWPDKTFQMTGNSKGRCSSADVRVATLNVGTMNYNTEEHTASSFKTRELLRQFELADVDVIGIQESRARFAQCVVEGPFFRIISEGNKGHDGVELWLRIDVLGHKLGFNIDTSKDLCVIHSSARLLVVHLNCHSSGIVFVVGYAPQRGRPDHEIQAWWDDTRKVLSECPGHCSFIMMGDLNCKVGRIPTAGIGTRAADFEDLGGQNLRGICDMLSMNIVNTMGHLHEGTDWTYMNPQGHRSRLDYIVVSDDLINGVRKSYIDDDIDPMNGGIDRRVLVVHFQIQ